MTPTELISALNELRVETGSLACLGCGYEHDCSIHGCRIIREAAERLAVVADPWIDVAKEPLPEEPT